jgi:hypothetical protein
LLARERGAHFATLATSLSEEQILAWADVHFRHFGKWPTTGSGEVLGAPFERWANVDAALRDGRRGLPRGSSVARLLAERRDARNPADLPRLSEEQILAWADAFRERTGDWPTEDSGPIPDSGGENWNAVSTALRSGARGLEKGSSLARLLAQRRGVRNSADVPNLDEETVLAWADAHFQREGKWPTRDSGPIPEAPGETWSRVNDALCGGGRGLSGKSSLARLLAARRGRRNHVALPPLRPEEILEWADAHFQRAGDWPVADSGPIPEAPGETWLAVEAALRDGKRGLPGGSSLARLLAQYRDRRNNLGLPPYTINNILAWADAHHRRTGEWPTQKSGPIPEAPGETWQRVDTALHDGGRGQPGGKSLARLLARKRGVRNIHDLPPLSVGQILLWADRHREQTGDWPNHKSGPIAGTVGESWLTVDESLRRGTRGLPGSSSIARLLSEHRGRRNRSRPPALTLNQVRAWAESHRQETGRWPNKKSGPVTGAPGEK